MSWNYSGDPTDSDLDAVRFYVQDTDSTDPLLSDEEIQYLIDAWKPLYGSLLFTASVVADVIASKFARDVAVSGDGVNVGVQDLQNKYEQLAIQLRYMHKNAMGLNPGTGAFAGGTLWDDNFDQTIKPLSFAKGMHDNRRSGQQNFGGQNPPPDSPYPYYADR